jgi:hypothetical protein
MGVAAWLSHARRGGPSKLGHELIVGAARERKGAGRVEQEQQEAKADWGGSRCPLSPGGRREETVG